MKTFLKTYRVELFCALAGAVLAVILGIMLIQEKAVTASKDHTVESTEHTELADADDKDSDVHPVLSDSYDDMTELVGYCLYGTHTVYDGNDTVVGKMTFGEDQSFTGYVSRATGTVSDGSYTVTMAEDGTMYVTISRGRDQEVSYEMTYDDVYRPVLTAPDEILTLEFVE